MDSEEDEECWDEMTEEHEVVECVFCTDSFQSTVALWDHCTATHKFDITDFKRKVGMYDHNSDDNLSDHHPLNKSFLVSCLIYSNTAFTMGIHYNFILIFDSGFCASHLIISFLF